MLICIRCGASNEEGKNYCQSCRALLPKISESVSAPPPERINAHYNQLKELGEKIQSGLISSEDYAASLERIYGIIEQRLQEIETMEIADEVRPSLEEQIQIGVSGIHFFLQGIEEMRLYLGDQNREHIAAGMDSIFQGNENLNAALEMARENIQKLRDLGIESEINITDEPAS